MVKHIHKEIDEEFATGKNAPPTVPPPAHGQHTEHCRSFTVLSSKPEGVKLQELLTRILQHMNQIDCLCLQLRWSPHLQAKSSFLGYMY